MARSPALVSGLLALDRERELPLVLPRVRLADVRLAALELLLDELRPEELEEPPRDREARARLVADACGPLPSPPLLSARDAPCVASELDAFPLDCGVVFLRDGALRCVAVAIF